MKSHPEGAGAYPENPDVFYGELVRRNFYFIGAREQEKLRRTSILIAGCGSTGGACVGALARAGVTRMILADNSTYELNNLNRQNAHVGDLGRSKATRQAEEVLGINPFAEVRAITDGVTFANVKGLVAQSDLIMDAIDVTTRSGILARIAMHRAAMAAGKPVLTALDVGFCQWGRSYDYRDPNLAVLDGADGQAERAIHPLKALFSFVPLAEMPAHSLPLIRDILRDSEVPASQLGCTSDLLSALIVPVVLRFAAEGELAKGWRIDLDAFARPAAARLRTWLESFRLRREIRDLLDALK